VEHERLRVLAEHLHQPAQLRPLGLAGEHGVLADEAAGLLEVEREAEPGLVRVVGVVEVVAVVAVALLHAQA
jgi:hypothetical protein